MRKLLIYSVVFFILLSLNPGIISANYTEIKISIDGKTERYYPEPIIHDGTTLVPMRAIFQRFGASIDWNQDTSTVTATKDDKTIMLTIGESTAYVNGLEKYLEVPPQIINRSTMVPLRFVSEAFGADVAFDPDQAAISIFSNVVLSKGYALSTANTSDSHIRVQGKTNEDTDHISVEIVYAKTKERFSQILKVSPDHECNEDIILPFGSGEYNLILYKVNAQNSFTYETSFFVRNSDTRKSEQVKKEMVLSKLSNLGIILADTETTNSQMQFSANTQYPLNITISKQGGGSYQSISLQSCTIIQGTLDFDDGSGEYIISIWKIIEESKNEQKLVYSFPIQNKDERSVDFVRNEHTIKRLQYAGLKLSDIKTNNSVIVLEGKLANATSTLKYSTIGPGNKQSPIWDLSTIGDEASLKRNLYLRDGAGDYTLNIFGIGEKVISLKITNLDVIDRTDLFPTNEIQSDNPEIVKLSQTIIAGKQTDLEKIRAIHDWVAHNIAYDVKNYFDNTMKSEDYTALAVLKNKKAICQGYSQLTAALARAAGLRARVVGGIGGTENIENALSKDPDNLQKFANHAWNEVLCDGKWVIMDTTWDAGGVGGNQFYWNYTTKYFNPSPQVFRKDHLKT